MLRFADRRLPTSTRTRCLGVGLAVLAVATTSGGRMLITDDASAASLAGRHGHQSLLEPATRCSVLLRTFGPPPERFDPLRASRGTLLANGFPPRPPSSGPGAAIAVAAWRRAMDHSRNYAGPPHPVCASVRHSAPPAIPRLGPNYVTHITTGNYAGFGTPYTYDGTQRFTWAESTWVQPSVPGNSNYTDYKDAPDASLWTGTGGSKYIIQAGADSIATSTPQYRFWTEDYPNDTVWEGPTIRPGQTAYAYTLYQGSSQCYYYLLNESTGSYQSFVNSCPYDGDSNAYFINERLSGHYLPDYDLAAISSNAYGNGSSYNLSQDTDQYRMTSNCLDTGVLLSEPSTISDSSFIQYWDASSPFSDSC